MKKSKIIFALIVVIILVIIFINRESIFKSNDRNMDEITGFYYYSGSVSARYGSVFTGIVQGEIVDITFENYSGENKNKGNYTITFDEFKKVLKKSKKENCKKQTYEYQCGEQIGCGYSTFFVNYSNDSEDKVCYEISNDILELLNPKE